MGTVPLPSPADVALADSLTALGSPTRLAIARQLQQPRILSDIRVAPEDAAEDGETARPIARQAVKKHLLFLLEHGFVTPIHVDRRQGSGIMYVLNQQRVFRLVEELRELATLRPLASPPAETVSDARPVSKEIAPPRLLLVRGLGEGKTFSLAVAKGQREASWMIGRGDACDLPIDYDPFVSIENTILTWRDGSYFATSLPQSKNGTFLNYRALPPSAPIQMRHGDALTVGRTTFVAQFG